MGGRGWGGRGGKGGQGVSGQGDQRDWGGGAGGVQTLVFGGPISKGVYSGGAPPVLKHQARKAPIL